MFPFVLLALGVLCPVVIEGFHNGAPPTSCRTMSPGHPGSPQTVASPYVVTFQMPSGGGYEPSQQIVVNITSTTSSQFMGFMLMAKNTEGQPVGTFTGIRRRDGIKLMCDQQAVTHTTNRRHRSVGVKWQAPSTPAGNVIFTATVTESYWRYWTDIVAEPLRPAPRA